MKIKWKMMWIYYVFAALLCSLVTSCSNKYERAKAVQLDQPIIKYARCNIRILKGNVLSIKNLQSISATTIPVGSQVTFLGPKYFVVGNDNTEYIHKLGIGSISFEKFFVNNPPNISALDNETINNIRQVVIRVGMSKEASYMAMGPPLIIFNSEKATYINTYNSTYEQIIASNQWIYYRGRSRFEKRIGVEFDSVAGKVIRTEGIWR